MNRRHYNGNHFFCILLIPNHDLEPGQTAPFNIIVDSPIAKKITSASLNVGSKQYSSIIQNERS